MRGPVRGCQGVLGGFQGVQDGIRGVRGCWAGRGVRAGVLGGPRCPDLEQQVVLEDALHGLEQVGLEGQPVAPRRLALPEEGGQLVLRHALPQHRHRPARGQGSEGRGRGLPPPRGGRHSRGVVHAVQRVDLKLVALQGRGVSRAGASWARMRPPLGWARLSVTAPPPQFECTQHCDAATSGGHGGSSPAAGSTRRWLGRCCCSPDPPGVHWGESGLIYISFA